MNYSSEKLFLLHNKAVAWIFRVVGTYIYIIMGCENNTAAKFALALYLKLSILYLSIYHISITMNVWLFLFHFFIMLDGIFCILNNQCILWLTLDASVAASQSCIHRHCY